jgi:hypothetical protein
MSDELTKRLRRNRHLARHLTELGCLLRREVRPEDLLSLYETEVLLGRAAKRTPGRKETFPFADKARGRLSLLVHAFQDDLVYLWTALTNDCGVYRAVPLAEIDFSFPFEFSPEGILSVVSQDLGDRILLDWYEEGGVELLDLEVTGPRWSATNP